MDETRRAAKRVNSLSWNATFNCMVPTMPAFSFIRVYSVFHPGLRILVGKAASAIFPVALRPLSRFNHPT
jgi:hypothetical protein